MDDESARMRSLGNEGERARKERGGDVGLQSLGGKETRSEREI